MALAVVPLMLVKVTTVVGAIYVPHEFVQVYDFDPSTIFGTLFSPWRRDWSPPCWRGWLCGLCADGQ